MFFVRPELLKIQLEFSEFFVQIVKILMTPDKHECQISEEGCQPTIFFIFLTFFSFVCQVCSNLKIAICSYNFSNVIKLFFWIFCIDLTIFSWQCDHRISIFITCLEQTVSHKSKLHSFVPKPPRRNKCSDLFCYLPVRSFYSSVQWGYKKRGTKSLWSSD